MKECPKCHSKVSDTTKFCPECGDQFPASESDTAIILSTPKAIQKSKEDSNNIKVSDRDDDALAFVYIAQYALKDGPERAGVLVECAGVQVEDCTQYFRGINHLRTQGAIREKKWAKLRGYITTGEGSRRAALVIQQRLNQSKDILKKMLDNLPITFVRFFRDEVVLGEGGDWYDYRRLDPIDVKEISSNNHLCLLNDNKIKKLRDEVMTTLVNQGLGEISHSYAVVDGGRVTDPVYSLAPEVTGFFNSYLTSRRTFAGPLFDNNLEAKHRLYHQLSNGIKLANKNYFDIANLGPLNMLPRAVLADLQKVFTNLKESQVVNRDPDRVFIQNTVVFMDVVRQEFFVPLVDHLLSPFAEGNPEIAGQPTSIVTTDDDTDLIRVDQIDLLFGESGDE
jgi:RNA polymerase subunit RPABC4/transcription elongation factor Spt4